MALESQPLRCHLSGIVPHVLIGNAYNSVSENHLLKKRTLTVTPKTLILDLLQPLYNSEINSHDSYDHKLNYTARKWVENDLPLYITVTYPHPAVIALLVLGLTYSPHTIKKQTNAFKRGNLRGSDLLPVVMKTMKDVDREIHLTTTLS